MQKSLLRVAAVAVPVLFAGCTTARLEYDRMTGTDFPDETVVDGDTVGFDTIYIQGNIALTVMEDNTAIQPLTGPFDATAPDQYDYITSAEVETIELAFRQSPVGSHSWACPSLTGRCTRYHTYGIVADHYYEASDGTRDTTMLGLMYDALERSAFVNYYKTIAANYDNAAYLRSAAHEVGHTFNLNHCDGDGATTIMNQTGVVGTSYTYDFSSSSLEHLQEHPKEVVWPGLGPREYDCPHVH